MHNPTPKRATTPARPPAASPGRRASGGVADFHTDATSPARPTGAMSARLGPRLCSPAGRGSFVFPLVGIDVTNRAGRSPFRSGVIERAYLPEGASAPNSTPGALPPKVRRGAFPHSSCKPTRCNASVFKINTLSHKNITGWVSPVAHDGETRCVTKAWMAHETFAYVMICR